MAIPTSDILPEQSEPSPSPSSEKKAPSSTRSIIEWLVVIAGAIAVALVIKTFVMQAFFIPSESMKPTLEINDRVLVNKLSYHLHDIARGDVVVFEKPDGDTNDQIKDLIKRVVALPGETVVFDQNKVYINGKLLNEPYLPAGTITQPGPGLSTYPYKCTVDDPCKIPPGTVWVMGDNRTNSKDSRYLGPIPQDKIVGRAFVTVWPFSRFGGL
jgi:signal peptidase I